MVFFYSPFLFFAPFLHGKSEKQEKFCRIFVLVVAQKYIFRVYF